MRSRPRSRVTVALGRAARVAARLRGGGSGGTAFPGLVMERTDPGFLARTLGDLPMGVIVVSGTNGKTTTTKMVVELLRDQGLRVFTNRTGSNFVRGVLAALLTEVDRSGKLAADVAVLELDEAHAVRFVRLVRPRACLLLNVMRDQLDRFGEIDYTAALLRKVAAATTEVVVVNADDPRLSGPDFLTGLSARTRAFGAGPGLRSLFLSDDELRIGAPNDSPAPAVAPSDIPALAPESAGDAPTPAVAPSDVPAPDDAPGPAVVSGDAPGSAPEPAGDGASPAGAAPAEPDAPVPAPARVLLMSLTGQRAEVSIDGVVHTINFAIPGIHNQLNACAALALCLEVLGQDADLPRLLSTLSQVQAAFGRGEVLSLDNRDVQLALVKNPAGFRMSLLSTATVAGPETIMIAINDEYADGRDMSWLWDVDFSALRAEGVAVVTGVRAWDMALRLRYDEVPIGVVEPDLDKAIAAWRETAARQERPMRVFTTYTAMLALRARLGELTEVEEVMS